MSDYRRKANNGMNTTEQTAAQWAVDGRVFDVNCVLVPTDGPDQGKHKMADGIHNYNDLDFVEDGGGSGDTFTPFIYLTSGSVTAAYRKQGTLNGKDWFVKVGETATAEYPEYSVLWTEGGEGWGWYISTGSALVLYYSTEDVATPDLVETWTADGGTGSLPSVAYYGDTSQEAMEALAKGGEVGNTVFVDAVAGDDDTGARGRADRPFQGCEAASAAAVAGDLVRVRPGAYTVDDSVAKNGVNWYLDEGVSISMTQTGEFGIFDDKGTAMIFTVGGMGEITMASNSEDYAFVGAVKTSHDDSVVVVRCKSIHATDGDTPADSYCAVNGAKGTLYVHAEQEIKSTGFGYCIYWENGPMFVTAPRISGHKNGAVSSVCTETPTGKFWVRAHEITNNGDALITPAIFDGSSQDAQVWIEALEVSNEGIGPAIHADAAARVYVTAQKIGASDGPAIYKLGTGTTWVTAQKIAGNTAHIEQSAGTLYVETMHYDNANGAEVGVDMSGGTLHMNGGSMVIAAGNGIEQSSGTIRATDVTIDTSADDTSNPIVKSGGTLILKNCTLVAESTRDSIEAGSAQTVVSLGSYANKAVDGNVTVDGSLTVGSYVQ